MLKRRDAAAGATGGSGNVKLGLQFGPKLVQENLYTKNAYIKMYVKKVRN
jgi:hypothetical protein